MWEPIWTPAPKVIPAQHWYRLGLRRKHPHTPHYRARTRLRLDEERQHLIVKHLWHNSTCTRPILFLRSWLSWSRAKGLHFLQIKLHFSHSVVDVHLVESPDQCTRCTEASAHLSAEGSIRTQPREPGYCKCWECLTNLLLSKNTDHKDLSSLWTHLLRRWALKRFLYNRSDLFYSLL
jgi:hypothetical protein